MVDCTPIEPPPFGWICTDDDDVVVALTPFVDADGTPLVQGPLRACGTNEILCPDTQVALCPVDTSGAPTSYGPPPVGSSPRSLGAHPMLPRIRINRVGETVFPYSVANHPDQLIDIVDSTGAAIAFNLATGRFTLPEIPAFTECDGVTPLGGSVPNCLLFEDDTVVPVNANNQPLIPLPFVPGCSYMAEDVKVSHIEDPFQVGNVINAGVPEVLGLASIAWTNDLGCAVAMLLKVELNQQLGNVNSALPQPPAQIYWSINGGAAALFADLGYNSVVQQPTVGSLFFARSVEMGVLAPGATLTVGMSELINPGFDNLMVLSGSWGFSLVVREVVLA